MDLSGDTDRDERAERRRAWWRAGLFALVAVLAGVDLVADLIEGTAALHGAIEALLVVAALAGLASMMRTIGASARRERELRAELSEVTGTLADTRAEAERWKTEAADQLRGLGATIDEQLSRWQLSVAEKEVALLLLKGLSAREIAEVREVAEATVRQQSRAIYRKSGLRGRRELAAFFLEDLLLPPAQS